MLLLSVCICPLQAESGSLDEAADKHRAQIEAGGAKRNTWIDYIKIEAWRGNYIAALEALENYRGKFGADKNYHKEKARVLAWANRPTTAQAINGPLLEKYPDDYEINYTRTVILKNNRQPQAALDSLATLKRLRPNSKDTSDAIRFVKTPLRHNMNLGLYFYNDSDDIHINRYELYGNYFLQPTTRVGAGYNYEYLKANVGSGFDTVDGQRSIHHTKGWLSIAHRLNPQWAIEARLGRGEMDNNTDFTYYKVRLDWQPQDNLSFWYDLERDVYSVSPRAISHRILQTGHKVHVEWQPNLKYTFVGEAAYGDFNDTNERQEIILSPRRQFLRSEKFNLDLGVSAQWISFDKDLGFGYYDPQNYRRFAATAFGYWKINDDNGISIAASLGWHKDEDISSYKLGEDIALHGYFGIYKNWMLRARLGWADRGNQAGGYDGASTYLTITRRF